MHVFITELLGFFTPKFAYNRTLNKDPALLTLLNPYNLISMHLLFAPRFAPRYLCNISKVNNARVRARPLMLYI